MSRPDGDAALRPLARQDGEPVFDEPWQAEVLGLACALAGNGAFTPAQWSQALGAEHRRLLTAGAPDTAASYYRAALAALERLMTKDALSPESISARTEEWRRAYLATPHGQPVALTAGHGTPR